MENVNIMGVHHRGEGGGGVTKKQNIGGIA